MESPIQLAQRWRDRAATMENGDGASKLAAYNLRFAADELDGLGLHVEGRQLSDGVGGMTTDWRTGETSTAGNRPCTRQIRWCTDWFKDDGMTLPAMAYVPTP